MYHSFLPGRNHQMPSWLVLLLLSAFWWPWVRRSAGWSWWLWPAGWSWRLWSAGGSWRLWSAGWKRRGLALTMGFEHYWSLPQRSKKDPESVRACLFRCCPRLLETDWLQVMVMASGQKWKDAVGWSGSCQPMRSAPGSRKDDKRKQGAAESKV